MFRMSAEDLEIHHPSDTPLENVPLRGYLGDGLVRKAKGILRGGSLPSLLDCPREEDCLEDTDGNEVGEKPMIKISVEHIE